MCQKKRFLLQNFSPGCCYKLKMCPLGSLLSEWQYFLFEKKNEEVACFQPFLSPCVPPASHPE